MIPLSWYMALAAVLFCIGVAGFLTRRNIIVMLLSLELMLNGVNLNLVAMSYFMDALRGQAFTIFIITVAACEAAGIHVIADGSCVLVVLGYSERGVPAPSN